MKSKILLNKMKLACKTNEQQLTTVCLLTCLNIIPLLCSQGTVPIFACAIALLFWPILAFLCNLINPID